MVDKKISRERAVENALGLLKDGPLNPSTVTWVDLQFTSVPGRLHHVQLSASEFEHNSFAEGFPKLDGSSVRGFGAIEESDFRLRPVPETINIIPWMPNVARMIAEVHNGGGRGRFERDPRAIAEKAESFLDEKGNIANFGPELEFFVLDSIDLNFTTPQAGTGFRIHSSEAPWENTGGIPVRRNDGYYTDTSTELRLKIGSTLKQGFKYPIIATHHEVAVAQWEITSMYGTPVEMADRLQTIKWVIRKMAEQEKRLATFMPKPIFEQNASGMHVHYSQWDKKGTNLMFEEGAEAELSQTGRYAVGGLLRHARALAAISNPTTNSYRRLITGFEAPVYTAWSEANRSAVVRIPGYEQKGNASAKRLEFRQPDPSANPYLLFAAMTMAVNDGIKRKLDPGSPVKSDIYHMTAEQRKALGIGELPGSLTESIDALKSDSSFLRPVFPTSLLRTHIDMCTEDIKEQQRYPHPVEIHRYLDV